MNTSYYNGITGMKTSQVGIDILSDNISNVNTMGYKQGDVDFSTLFSTSLNTALSSPVSSDIGMSATAASSVINLSQGSIQSTDNVFDMAIAGQGWMAVKDENDNTYYTRTGSFTRDGNGDLVTQSGEKLQVVNPKTLSFDGEKWTFDSTIDTTNLITDDVATESITLPENIIFPAEATQNVKLAGNLENSNIAPTPKAATSNNDLGVLYDTNAQNMNLKNDQDVVFGFGDNMEYSNSLIKYNVCVFDDTIDNQNVNIDFDVNGINIKTTLPDGSSSKEIMNAITTELDKNNILYDVNNNILQIKSPNELFIKSNGGDVITSNSSMQKLVYNSTNNENNNFTTMQDFMDKLQNLSDFTYGENSANVSLNDEGQIIIANNSISKDITSSIYATDNSNDLFLSNLSTLNNTITPNKELKSLNFNQNYQGFSGDIIDSEGNRNTLKFDFYKSKIDSTNTVWKLDVSQIDTNGEVISTTTQDVTFDNMGGLLTPTEITIDNGGTPTTINLGGGFSGITSTDKQNSGFSYFQDGLVEGYLVDYDVNDLGQIVANFSNSKSGVVAQIPIYHFQNEQGLDSVGSNKFSATANSGEAFFYHQDGNYLEGAQIVNHSLESSNVNISQAMTELIIYQKAFDANSKSITTSDQMIQKAIDMKR